MDNWFKENKILYLEPEYSANDHEENVYCIAVDTRIGHLKSISEDGIMCIRDLYSKKLIRKINCKTFLKENVLRKLILIPNTDILLYGGSDSLLIAYNIESSLELFTIPFSDGILISYDITLDGSHIILYYYDSKILVFNLKTHKIIYNKKREGYGVAFLKNDSKQWVLGPSQGGGGGEFKIFNNNLQTVVKNNYSFLYRHMIYFSSKNVLICGHDDEIHFVDCETYKVKLSFRAFDYNDDKPSTFYFPVVPRINVSSINIVDDTHFACGSECGQIKIFNVNEIERAFKEETQRTFMSNWVTPSIKRLFIFGAGASIYAGFPLGEKLIDFILRSSSIEKKEYTLDKESEGFAWLLAYILTSPDSINLQKDPEKALTDLVSIYYGKDVFPQLGTQDIELKYRYLDNFTPFSMVGPTPKYIKGSLSIEDEHRIEYREKYPPKWNELDKYGKEDCLKSFSNRNETIWSDINSTIEVIDEALKDFFSLQSLINTYVLAFISHQNALRLALEKDEDSFYTKQLFSGDKNRFDRFKETVKGIRQYFKEGDLIITFNWDAFFEYILSDINHANLPALYGIGIAWDPECRNIQKLCKNTSPIYILKPHGSISWMDYEDEEIWMKRNINKRSEIYLNNLDKLFGWEIHSTFYAYELEAYNDSDFEEQKLFSGSEPDENDNFRKFQIMSPFYLKDYSKIPVLNELWQNAAKAIEKAPEIIVCGYSLPESDLHAMNLIKTALSKNKNCKIKIVSKKRPESWENLLDLLGKEFMKGGDFWFDEWMCENKNF